MPLRHLMNFIEGAMEAKNIEYEMLRNITFGASKFNALASAQSKKQAQALKKHRFDWEKKKSTGYVTLGQILPMLNAINKAVPNTVINEQT